MPIRLFLRSLSRKAKHLCSHNFIANNESMLPFEEKAGNDKKRQAETSDAHRLFESFTAGIIKENTLFTR